MNILYVTQFFSPEITAGAFRAYENSLYWKRNNNITILTTYPNYPKGETFGGYKNKLVTKENINDINVIRVKSIIKKNTKQINRLVLYISFLLYAFLNTFIKNIKVKEYDVIIGSSGPIFTPIYAWVISKIYKIPYVLELRDITFVQMLGTFTSDKSIYFKLIKGLELFLCEKADHIVVTTNSFKNILTDNEIQHEKISVITNGVSVDENKDYEKSTKEKDLNNISFCYAGTFGISQDLIEMINFFIEIDTNNKKLYLIGDGAEKEKIEEYIEKNRLDNVIVLNPMPKEHLESFYTDVDICLVKLKNQPQFSNFIPSKLFHIMYSRKPVLYLGPKGEVTKIIDESNCGLYLCNESYLENASQFNKHIREFQTSEEFKLNLSENGLNGYKYCTKNYDRRMLAKEYLTIFEKLVNER